MIIVNIMRKLLLLIISFSLLASPLWAAAIPDDAQRELSSQTNALNGKDKKMRLEPAEKPEIEIREEEEKLEEEEGPIFFVKKIEVEGNTVIPTQEFEPVLKAFENRKTSFRNLRASSDIITNLYRSQGFITSRAYFPPQAVDGVATIKIIEGKVGKVFVEGNRYFSAQSYQKYMKFESNDVFRYQDLERNLYYLNQMPDRKVKAFLIPGEQLAASDIILKVKDSNPFHAYYDFNDHGTKLTHRQRHVVHLDHHNITGHDDTLDTSFTTAEEAAFDGGSFSYSLPCA